MGLKRNKVGLVVVSGWGYPALRREDFSLQRDDLDGEFFSYDFEEWMRIGEVEQAKLFQSHGRFIVVGWSLGGYLLGPHLRLESVLGALLLAVGAGFVRAPKNPYGVPEGTLDRLRAQLKRSPEKTMNWFYKASSSPNQQQKPRKRFEVNALLEGLDVLASARLDGEAVRSSRNKKPQMAVVAGSEDAIYPWRACEWFSQANGHRFFLRRGQGHDLVYNDGAFLGGLLLNLAKGEG